MSSLNNKLTKNGIGLEYTAPADAYDEACSGQPDTQDSWRYVLDGIAALGIEGMRDRQLKAKRILRDDGATYNSQLFPFSTPWPLDPIPALLVSEEWSRIETGLLERAELLNLVLKDIYGKRELIRHGVIPPELLYSHPGFLRGCQGMAVPGEHQLILHASDMIRAGNGSMHIVGDRTQAPSGAGYALENRTVMSRVLPSLFRDSRVHRLALFFQTLRLKLMSLGAALTAEQPRVVILTPGSYNETYFEHAYLANYLGLPLVQGSDLRVSNGYLWLKSLGGLERVDVVLRRVDDFFCDPVELKSDSRLGVAGLLEVVRSGNVVVVNPLGSGVLENPALQRYLPQIAQHFLGRDLRIPSIPTYWCGDEKDRAYVLANLDKLVLKACFSKPGVRSIFGFEQKPQDLEKLRAQIEQNPLNVVAQEYMKPSTMPVWRDDRLISCPSMLRGFAVASHSSYSIMPGGLTRVGQDSDSLSLSNQQGALSKDTWILASEPEKQLSLRDSSALSTPLATQQRAAFPCRVVENLYWMGRYAERAESALRLLRTVFVLFNSTYQMPEQTQQLLLRTVTELTTTYPGFTADNETLIDNPEPGLIAVVLDEHNPGSVTANLNALLRCTDQVREMLSADTQRVINDLRDELEALPEALQNGLNAAPEEALDPLVTTLLALSGLWQESMIRGLGWRFMDMGRRVEKALQAVRLVRASLVPVLPESEQQRVLEAVLLSSEILITFRRRYQSGNDIERALELLLYDNSNPRSVFYQINLLKEHVAELPAAAHGPGLAEEDRYLLEASSAIQLSRLHELEQADEKSRSRANLDQLLARLQHLLQEISTQLSSKYFDQIKVHQQLVRTDWDEEL